MNRFILLFTLLMSNSWSLNAQSGLTKAGAEKLAEAEIARQKELQHTRAAADWEKKEITIQDKTMKFMYKISGSMPPEGRSLYISMHGGGNGPAAMNDQQWSNQIKLYTPKEGVYVAPRAPTNTWNLWHEDHIDDLMEQLIKDAIIMEGVNPNKVYIMGYSAGGDGTFQLAPRMADHWAAAAMMAGHPGDASALSLKNLPFAIYMGGADAAYNRNQLAAVWGRKLDSLQADAPGHYIHDLHIYPGMPHWMGRKDTIAMPWMASFIRNPLPKQVSWHQDDRLRSRFYWLGLPDEGRIAHAEVRASFSGNTISIQENQHPVLYIYLNDHMMDLDRKIRVVYKGKVLFNSKIKRNVAIIKATASRMDRDLVFSAGLSLIAEKVSSL
ncbi:dienelactone hydrolase family protein [Pedobacter sp. GR22-6]|uniref:dienelactone hydrolase family protein n=1 Tax=Pedobacter sp. GR22-6 TaxID=3127957 RepID=UPI00307EB6A5